jgi:hypothetical protein
MNLTAIRRHWWKSIQEFAPILGISPEDLEDFESKRREIGDLEELFTARLVHAGLLPLPDGNTSEIENGPLQRTEFKEIA